MFENLIVICARVFLNSSFFGWSSHLWGRNPYNGYINPCEIGLMTIPYGNHRSWSTTTWPCRHFWRHYLKTSHQERKVIFQPSFFRGELLNFMGVFYQILSNIFYHGNPTPTMPPLPRKDLNKALFRVSWESLIICWFLQGSLYDTNPNNALFLGEILEHYHRFPLFDSPQLGSNLMIPGLWVSPCFIVR